MAGLVENNLQNKRRIQAENQPDKQKQPIAQAALRIQDGIKIQNRKKADSCADNHTKSQTKKPFSRYFFPFFVFFHPYASPFSSDRERADIA
jgi:hypothetical protein